MPCDAKYPPVGSRIGIVPPHDAAIRPRVLAYLYRLGVNAEYILGAINGYSYFLADFFSKPNRKLASGIELSPTDQVWKILLTLIMQSMKKKIFAVESEGFGSYAESNYFEVGELGDNATSGDIASTFKNEVQKFRSESPYKFLTFET